MRAAASGRGVGRDDGEARCQLSGGWDLPIRVLAPAPRGRACASGTISRTRTPASSAAAASRRADRPGARGSSHTDSTARAIFRTSTQASSLATGDARPPRELSPTPSSCPRGPHNAARATASTPSLEPGATVPRSSAARERDRRRVARARREVPCRSRCWAPPGRVMGTPPLWRRCARCSSASFGSRWWTVASSSAF